MLIPLGPDVIPRNLSPVTKGILLSLIFFANGVYWWVKSTGFHAQPWNFQVAFVSFILAASAFIATGIYALRTGT